MITSDDNGSSAATPTPSSQPLPGDPRRAFAEAQQKKDKRPRPSIMQLRDLLLDSDAWRGVVAFDEFSGRVIKRRPPPFIGGAVGEWSDRDDTECMMWIEANTSFGQPSEKDLLRAIDVLARQNPFHEVRDYLRGLTWDGTPRLADWLIDFAGAKPTEYVRVVGERWLVSGIARVMDPGCKADHVLILVGPQGRGKSSLLRVMAGDWFTDAPLRLGDKDAYMLIGGKWIVELGELETLSRSENSAIKLFFSQYIDRYREPWGKRASDVPRQCIFAGTVNSLAFLRDDTGARRFWPVEIEAVRIDALSEVRDQLWAEAYCRYQDGAIWWPLPEEAAMFAEAQEQHYIGDAWEPLIEAYVARKLVEDPEHGFSTTEIMQSEDLKLDPAKMDRLAQQRIGAILGRFKFRRRRCSAKASDGKRAWLYYPGKESDLGKVEL
jgi:putative DNA primase/helicase